MSLTKNTGLVYRQLQSFPAAVFWRLQTCFAAVVFPMPNGSSAFRPRGRAFLLLCALCILCGSVARAANVSFTFTNSLEMPDTNTFKVIPVSGPVAHADGSFTTIGLPIRLVPNASGILVTNLPQNNYLVTNAYLGQGYYIRVPQDSGPTVYPSGQLLISGGNVFVTTVITNGTLQSLTFEILTNVLGFTPLATTNLPALTNNFIAPIDVTNLFNALIEAPTNGFTSIVYSNGASFVNLPIFTNLFNALIVAPTNGMTSIVYSNPAAFTTPVTVTNITQALLMVATNGHIRLQDATNVFNALILNVTNVYGTIAYSNANAYTTIALLNSTSNALDSLISSGSGVSAQTVTNIASAATNGLISLKDATNVANAIAILTTNSFGTAAYSNAAAFYLSSNPNNYFSGLTVTNAFNALVALATNSLAVSNDMQTRFTLKNSGVATNLFLKTPTFSSFSSDGGSISSDGSGNVTMLQELLAGKIDVTDGSFLDQHNISTDGSGNMTAVSFNGSGAGLTLLNGTKITGVLTNNTTGNAGSATIATNLAAPGLTVVTNIGGLQGTNAANNQITNLVSGILTTSNYQGAINTSSNGGWNANTNFGLTTFVLEQGGKATNLVVTNAPAVSLTNFSIGTYLVFYQTTNVLVFNSSGTSSLTNANYQWAGAGAGLNYYTNTLTSGWVTNNGTVWQAFSSTGTQLFSSPSLQTNSWTLQGGTGTAASDYGFNFRLDGAVLTGIATVTNIVQGGSGILTLSGHGTNTYLTNLVVDWNSPVPSANSPGSSGAALNFQSGAFGQANTNSGSGYGAIILGGATNKLFNSGGSAIVAGVWNNLSGGFNNGNFIGAGLSNTINGVDDTFVGAGVQNNNSGGASFVGSGHLNNLQSVSYSSIVGGHANTNSASYAFIGDGTNNNLQSQAGAILTGFNNTVANPSVAFVNVGSIILGGSNNVASNTWWNLEWGQNIFSSNQWSMIFADSQINTTTNSQAILRFTNGVMVNTNNAGGNALQVLGSVGSTGGFNVGGTNITVLSTAPPITTPTNLNIAAAALAWQTTNDIILTNAGTSAVSNGFFHFYPTQGQFSNTVNGEIITNNGSTLNLYSSQGGSILYSSATLINPSWTVNAGASPAPGSYYAPSVDGRMNISGFFVSTNINRLIGDSNALAGTNGILVASQAGSSTNQFLTNPAVVAPTNIFTVTASSMGTNVTFYASTNYGSQANAISNALTLADTWASGIGVIYSNFAAGGSTVTIGPGIWDLSPIVNAAGSIIQPTTNITFLGSGKNATFLTVTNDQVQFPIKCSKSFQEYGNFSCIGALKPTANLGTHDVWFHDIAILPANNFGGQVTNRQIDGIWLSGLTLSTNRFTRIDAGTSFDTFNATPFGGSGNNYKNSWVYLEQCNFRAVCDTNTVSFQQRALAVTGGSNLNIVVNGTTLYAEQINTNSPWISSLYQTNDLAGIELDQASFCNIYLKNHSRVYATSTTTTPYTIEFTTGVNSGAGLLPCVSNHVYLEPDTEVSLASVAWNVGPNCYGNAIIWNSPPGITNYWLDGTNYSYFVLTTNSLQVPVPPSGYGYMFDSNDDLYWRSPQATKLITVGH